MKYFFVFIILIFSVNAFSQDYIILRNGDEIKAKVLEINETKIDYKRYTNINGPTYHLNKSDIFMIKYESGDKDIFNTSQTSTPRPKPVYNAPATTEFVYNPGIGTPNCQAQKKSGAKVYGNRANEVFFRQDVFFYGYDMTYLRLSNPKKVGQSQQLVQKYFNDWNIEFNKKAG
ncbi:MAG: hypothetical protein GXO88_07405, partial [Chlorobi bacterium]|nr:hypothetical protein [Chlorobiota bacterium]